MVDISTVGTVSVPKTTALETILPRAFRSRIVRYWHPLSSRATEIGMTPQGGVIYAAVHGKLNPDTNSRGLYS